MARGRPTKLTREVEDQLVRAISAGAYIETAAAFVGISKVSFYDWMRRGARAKSGRYKAFSERIKKAMAESEMRSIMAIQRAGDINWQAHAWYLERKYPERWGKRSALDVDHTGEVVQRHEGEISLTEKLIADPEFLLAIQQVAEERAEEDYGDSDSSGKA